MFPNQIILNGTNMEYWRKVGRQQVQIPTQAFIGCVTLGVLLSLSKPLFFVSPVTSLGAVVTATDTGEQEFSKSSSLSPQGEDSSP